MTLPRKGMTRQKGRRGRRELLLDPRANYPYTVRFDILEYKNSNGNGNTEDGIITTATMKRVDEDDVDYGQRSFVMRIYDPQVEDIPKDILKNTNTSTRTCNPNPSIYVYHGLDKERAPWNTIQIIIHPSVTRILKGAFQGCINLRRVVMHENIEIIEDRAFMHCHSLDALFLPPTMHIERIGDNCTFLYCTSLRILSFLALTTTRTSTVNSKSIIDTNIHTSQLMKRGIIRPAQEYDQVQECMIHNEYNQHQDNVFVNFHSYCALSPLHKTCLDMNVTASSIQECIDVYGIEAAAAAAVATASDSHSDSEGITMAMTPMQILALNPHADTGAILALFHVNVSAIFEPYSEILGHSPKKQDGDNDDNHYSHRNVGIIGSTPLNVLVEYNNVETHLAIIAALCRYREEQ